MSAYGMKPHFIDQAGYMRWRKQWRIVHADISKNIRNQKRVCKEAQRAGSGAAIQKQLAYQRPMAFKLMGLLQEAKDRWKRIQSMHAQIAEQMSNFPLVLEDCASVDFHFNKGHNEFPFLPLWVCKTKGKSYYIHHMTADCPWTTRETPEGSTKGMLRFRKCSLHIDENGEATVLASQVCMKTA